MKEKLQKIREEAVRQIEEAKELNALNDVRVSVLGKKGELTAVLKGMKDVKPEDRPMVGQLVNETREAIERTLEETKKKLESAELEHRLDILRSAVFCVPFQALPGRSVSQAWMLLQYCIPRSVFSWTVT